MTMQERPIPQPEHDRSVVVRVRAAGICGSDLHILHGRHSFAQYPIVPGHEVVGEVHRTGAAVKSFQPGDRVVLEPIRSCGQCYACRKGQPNVCEALYVMGAHGDGGWQEYYMADESNWHLLPPGVSWRQAVMIEPYTIGAQVVSRGKVGPDDVVLIHGAGPAGLIALDMAKEKGAQVIVGEILPRRIELARQFGADLVVDANAESVVDAVMRHTGGKGPTVVIDAAGLPDAFGQAVQILRPAGSIITMTFPEKPVQARMDLITLKELNIVGSRLQTKMFEPVIHSMTKRLEKIDTMITHCFPMAEADKAVELAASANPDVGKVIIEQ